VIAFVLHFEGENRPDQAQGLEESGAFVSGKPIVLVCGSG
jgi:hypothetical protein